MTFELIVGPPLPFPKTTVAPLQNKVPVVDATVPATALVVPLTENVKAPILSTPLLIIRLLTVVLAAMIQLFAPVTMVTLSAGPGMPFGVQFVFVPQLEDVTPFHVYDVCAFKLLKNNKSEVNKIRIYFMLTC